MLLLPDDDIAGEQFKKANVKVHSQAIVNVKLTQPQKYKNMTAKIILKVNTKCLKKRFLFVNHNK